MPFNIGDRVRGVYSRELGTITASLRNYTIKWDNGQIGNNTEVGLEPAPMRPKFQLLDLARAEGFEDAMKIVGVNWRTNDGHPTFEYTLRAEHGPGPEYHWAYENELEAA